MKQKFYTFTILSGLFLTLSLSGHAAPVQIGTTNTYWELKGNTLFITGTGAMADYTGPAQQPWFSDAGSIHAVDIESGVTAIGARAFHSCGSLVSVNIPESVITFGDAAFAYCTSLAKLSVYWPDPATLSPIPSNTFAGGVNKSNITLYIPADAEPNYSSGWEGITAKALCYDVASGTFADGEVALSPSTAAAYDIVTVTIKPDKGYELANISIFEVGNPGNPVEVIGAGNSRTFEMPSPAFAVTVEATFRNVAIKTAGEAIEDATYPVSQIYASTIDDLKAWLADYINGFVKDVTVTADDITISYFRPTTTGAENGSFSFSVKLADGTIAQSPRIVIESVAPVVPTLPRAVVVPPISGATSSLPAGRYFVESASDFTFTLTPFDPALVPAVRTGRTPDGSDVVITPAGDGSFTVVVTGIRQSVTLSIDFVTSAATPSVNGIRANGQGLGITASAPGEAYVYGLTGALVKVVQYPAGETAVALPAGLYIVRAGGKAYKLLVNGQ